MAANIDVRCVLLRTILLQCLVPVIGSSKMVCEVVVNIYHATLTGIIYFFLHNGLPVRMIPTPNPSMITICVRKSMRIGLYS